MHWRTEAVPAFPDKVDFLTGWTFDMGGNNQFGTCGPTSVANNREEVTALLTGREDETAISEVYDLYRRSGNPSFDPRTGRGDNGVVMSVMMNALEGGGLGGDKPLGYAQLADISDASIMCAIDRLGGVILAVSLQTAQSAQTDRGLWDYQRSAAWGGHAIHAGAYDRTTGRVDVVTWQKRCGTTAAFRRNQLDEVWVILWPEHVTSGKLFDSGLDMVQFAKDYEALTGRPFPVPLPDPPKPPIPSAGQVVLDLAARHATLPVGWTCSTDSPHGAAGQ